jgi:hypothetical protein
VPSQPLDGPQQRCLVGWGLKPLDGDVITQVERWCIDPQRTAETPPGHVEHLTESGQEMQSSFNRLLRGLDLEVALGIQEARAIEYTHSTDVLRPHLVRPQDHLVLRA